MRNSIFNVRTVSDPQYEELFKAKAIFNQKGWKKYVMLFAIMLSGALGGYVDLPTNRRKNTESNIINKRIMKIILILGITLFLLSAATLVLVCRLFLFHPCFDAEAYNYIAGKSKYEEVELSSEKGYYTGWLRKGNSKKTVLYFGGNAEYSAITLFNRETLELWDVFDGYNFVMIDYPKYGTSAGRLNEKNIMNMVDEAIDYITHDPDLNEEIVVAGYSMGTGPAMYAVSSNLMTI